MVKMECNDKNCPKHGSIGTRGAVIEGIVISDKMPLTVKVLRPLTRYISKYERYALKSTKIAAHNPSCINAKKGDKVKIMECRPISKTKSFVVISKEE